MPSERTRKAYKDEVKKADKLHRDLKKSHARLEKHHEKMKKEYDGKMKKKSSPNYRADDKKKSKY